MIEGGIKLESSGGTGRSGAAKSVRVFRLVLSVAVPAAVEGACP